MSGILKYFTPLSPNKSPPSGLSTKKSPSGGVAGTGSVRVNALKRRLDDEDNQQTIDAGQKTFGAVVCNICGMLYSPQRPSDVADHNKFHNRKLQVLRFPKQGWNAAAATLVLKTNDIAIYCVTKSGRPYAKKKVEDVCEIVNEDLGFNAETKFWQEGRQAYLLVLLEQTPRIAGICIVDPISKAFPMLSESTISEVPQDASIGINRIWVSPEDRRAGVATRLLNTIRSNFKLGFPTPLSAVAFSQPTGDGRCFAQRYTGRQDFLVYDVSC